MTHTEGPWAVWGSLYEGMAAAVVSGHAPGAELKTVAEVRDYRDACLLAAAPELLAALKTLHLKAVIGTDAERHDALNAAWAAISKAEGESSPNAKQPRPAHRRSERPTGAEGVTLSGG